MGYQVIAGKADVDRLVKGLLDRGRNSPWCVVSHTAQAPQSFLNLEMLSESVVDLAEVFLIEHGELTYQLSDLLPPNTGLYGDAARVYSPKFNEGTDPYEIPRYLLDTSNAKRIQMEIENQIWSLVDLSEFKKQREKREVRETVFVKKLYPPSVAVVELGNSRMATIRQEICFPGVPIQWIINEGDELSGTYDEVNNDFIPNGTQKTIQEIADHYGLGNVILGVVKSADRQIGEITIFPGVDVKITRDEISGNDRDLVMDFLYPGVVVPARLYRNPQGRISLRMDDIDDDEMALIALPVLEGGRPWLEEGRDVAGRVHEEVEDVVSIDSGELEPAELRPVTGSIPLPGPGLIPGKPAEESTLTGRKKSEFEFQISVLNGRLRDLEARIKLRETDVTSLSAELKRAEDQLARVSLNFSDERKKNTAAKRQGARLDSGKSTTESRRNRWLTDEEWFGEELRRAWIGRYKPEDRIEFNLDLERVSYGPVFFESLRESHISEEDLRKIVRVILDIVSGRNNTQRMHEVHPLRESAASTSKNLTRSDGAVCFRAYVEEKTAQAKRLHFWRLNDGFELSRVGLHDDMRV
jgi:hypothetical protein